MNKQQIKQKLRNFLEEYEVEIGGLKSLEVIYNYITFLKSKKYIQEVLKDVWGYAEKQQKILLENGDNIKVKDLLVLDPQNIPKLPVFKKEMAIYQKRFNAKDEKINIDELTPIFLMNLLTIHISMESIKNNELSNSIKQIKGLDVSQLSKNTGKQSMAFHNIKVAPDKNIVLESAKIHGAAIEAINKQIIDKIDMEEFLNKDDVTIKLSFNKEKSELNIFGQIIKIQRKSDKPFDHYILEYIFEQENIFDEADFQDIAREKLGMKDYNNQTDWNKLRNACDKLNKKVDEATRGKEKKFLKYHSGATGWCKINSKYQ